MIDPDIIEGLKESFVGEVYAANFAWQCYINFKASAEHPSSYDTYHKYFKKNFKDESKHRDIFAKLLAGYGEDAVLPTMEIPLFHTIEEMLLHQYKNEVSTIERYTKLADVCGEAGQFGLQSLFADLALDEEKDRQAIVKRLGYQPEI